MPQQRLVVYSIGLSFSTTVAAGRIFEPGHDPQQGRFAAARRPDQREAMDAVELEAHAVDHGVRAEPLHHIAAG